MRFKLESGLTVGYTVRGAGPVVALLHPIGLHSGFWAPIIERLAPTYRVIAIDFRGHGESDVPGEPFSLEQLADDCLELLRALAGPCAVVGCSMGSAVAQIMAMKGPDIVKAAIFANGSGPRKKGSVNALEARARRAIEGMPNVLDETIQRWFTSDFAMRHGGVVDAISQVLLNADPMVHSWAWQALAKRTDDYSAIRIPTLALTGSEDASATPASVQALAAALPNCHYAEISHTGHMAALEKSEEFHAVVQSFLERVEIPKPGAQ